MDDRTYRFLIRIAIFLTVLWVGWTIYDSYDWDKSPHAQRFEAATRFLEDDRPQDALAEYAQVLREDPDNTHALRGRAQARALSGRTHEALADYDEAITIEESRGVSEENRPILGVSYANRGILKDRRGDYAGALADYQRALELQPEVGDGPGWLTRFLRNQADKPSNVADRAGYLREQLAKPESERVLRLPELDKAQRPYKM